MGDLPGMILSKPRNIMPELFADITVLDSTYISTRRSPSILLNGSIVINVVMAFQSIVVLKTQEQGLQYISANAEIYIQLIHLKETAFFFSLSGQASFDMPEIPTNHAFGTSRGRVTGTSPIFLVLKYGRCLSGKSGEVQAIQGNPPLVQLPVRPSQSLSLQSDSQRVPLHPRNSNKQPC